MRRNKASFKRNLIFDVGMHKGEDTEYYLKRGFQVIAFEANSQLIDQCKKTFSTAIASGDLHIVEGAIVQDGTLETVKFYINSDSSVWGTVNPEFAERNQDLGTSNTIVEVKAVNFTSCLAQFGIPYFMKIDIEGADRVCLDALDSFDIKPRYVSVESDKVNFAKLIEEIDLLEQLGYEDFKAVQQGNVPKMKIPQDSKEGTIVEYRFSKEASGMFGSDLEGEWLKKNDLIDLYVKIFEEYRRFGDETVWQKNRLARKVLKGMTRLTGKHYPGWYDTHARHRSFSSES